MMKYFLFSSLLCLIIISCTSNTEEKQVTTPLIFADTTQNNLQKKEKKQPEEPPTITLETNIYDLDNNGINDTIIISKTYDIDTIKVILNGKTQAFGSVSVYFGAIKSEKIQNKNLIESEYCVVFQNSNKDNLIYVKDVGDFAGPVNLILGVKENQIEILLNEGQEPIAIETDSLKTYLIVQEIVTEPGMEKGYTYSNYPSYIAFDLSIDRMDLDANKTIEYNLDFNDRYDEFIKMSNPVVGSRNGTEDSVQLFDLDTVK